MPKQTPMTDNHPEDMVSARILAQRIVDMARAEGQRLIENGLDPDSADEIVAHFRRHRIGDHLPTLHA